LTSDVLQGLENARLELSAPSKMQWWKMQNWKYRHHVTGGGKCGTGIIGTNLQGWKMRDQAVMESQSPTCYGTHNVIYLVFFY